MRWNGLDHHRGNDEVEEQTFEESGAKISTRDGVDFFV